MRSSLSLAIALAVLAAASLVHHIHNAEFLADYPNMPAWLTRAGVYAAWLLTTSIGAIGYWRRSPLLILAYALYGIGALTHYAVAPLSAHTAMMHVTIVLEAAAAAVLLLVLLRQKLSSARPSP